MKRSPCHRHAALITLGILVVFSGSARAQTTPSPMAPAPLFAEDAPLDLTLTLDFDAVFKDRADERDYQPALAAFTDPADTEHTLTLGVKTRGNFRLHWLNCDVPPLRLNFVKKQVTGTLFEGQDKLKLVTHCLNRSSAYQQYVLEEYLIYKAYNLLTDLSFQVRLLQITYVDSRGEDEPITRFGFLIEDDDSMAARNGGQVPKSHVRYHPEATDRALITLMSVFQYMIGNTDWGVTTWHNIRLVFLEPTGPLVAVPYDFDWAGLINTPYATPDPQLGLRSVRERRFMGFCRTEDEYAAAFDRFVEHKEALYGLFTEMPYLEDKYKTRAIDYLDDFYKTLADPKRVRRAFVKSCQG